MYPANGYIPSPIEKRDADPSSLDERAWRLKVHHDSLCRRVCGHRCWVSSASLLVRAYWFGVLTCAEDVDRTRPDLLPLVQG